MKKENKSLKIKDEVFDAVYKEPMQIAKSRVKRPNDTLDSQIYSIEFLKFIEKHVANALALPKGALQYKNSYAETRIRQNEVKQA